MPLHLYPGPWVQPADTWELLANGGFVQYDDDQTAASQPDPGGTGSGITTLSSTGFVLAATYDVTENTDFAGLFIGWRWQQQVWAGVVDLAADIDVDNRGLANVPPPPGWDDDPDAYDYEYETDAGGLALGPIKVVIADIAPSGRWVDDTDHKTLDPAESDVFASRVRLARLPAADYTFDPGVGPTLAPDAFPTRSFLASLTRLVDIPVARSGADMYVGSVGAGTDNDLQGTYTESVAEMDMTLGDLDDSRRFAAIMWIDRTETGSQITLPSPGPDIPHVSPEWSANGFSSPAVQVNVFYRPVRWRILYSTPRGVIPLRQRQTSTGIHTAGTPLRQRQHHFGLRQRQTGI